MNFSMPLKFLFFIFLVSSAISEGTILEISPQKGLVDTSVEIVVKDVDPHQNIVLQATTYDQEGGAWHSWGRFEADQEGNIALNKQAPLEGSYTNIDPMGLFWAMAPENKNVLKFKPKGLSFTVSFKLIVNDKVVASFDVERLMRSNSVKRIPIKKDGLVGVLFLPPSQSPLATIITLEGSQGGIHEAKAQLLASHGYAVFALGYFGMKDLPQDLVEIPLEYFSKAIDWLKSRSELNGKIGLYGCSRGAELALLLGTFLKSVDAIAAVMPSSVVQPGLKPCTSAWSYQDVPLPAAAIKPAVENRSRGCNSKDPIVMKDNFIQGMVEDPQAFANAAIHVEHITSPLLTIAGGADNMWPSALYANQIQEKMSGRSDFVNLYYSQAGHSFGIPFIPCNVENYGLRISGGKWYSLGGTPQEDDLANRDSWEKVILFFEDHLIK